MSYDFYIAVDTGGPEPHYIDHPEGNYTSNVSGMWAKCLTAALDDAPDALAFCGSDARDLLTRRPDLSDRVSVQLDRLCLRDLHGKEARTLIPVLTAAVKWGWAHLDELAEGNPENGWGNADGAMKYLNTILTMCEAHPLGRLEISS
jgi:hypothetical protein